MPTLISREQYNSLSSEEKLNWAPYTPTSDPQVTKEIDLATAEAKAAAYMKPIHDKLAALPIENLPAEKLKEIVDKFNPLMSAYKAIQSLLGLPIIGQLVAPLVDFINSLIQIIGGIFYLIFVLSRGQELFLDGIHNVIENTDWDGLEAAMQDMKRKKKEMEAQKEQDKKNREVKKKNAEKVKKLIDAKMAKEQEEFKERINKAYDNMQIAEAAAQVARKMDQTMYIFMTWKYMKVIITDIFGMLGIDLSPLDQVTPEQAKAFEKSFPDPTNHIKEMNTMINKMNKDIKYIPLEELEKIDKETADEIRKSRSERQAELAESRAAYEERQKKAKERMDKIEKEAEEREKKKQEDLQARAEIFSKTHSTSNTIK